MAHRFPPLSATDRPHYALHIAARLKQARRLAGYSQRRVRAIICEGDDGLPPRYMGLNTLARFEEDGHRGYDLALVARCCRLYGVTLDAVVGLQP